MTSRVFWKLRSIVRRREIKLEKLRREKEIEDEEIEDGDDEEARVQFDGKQSAGEPRFFML